MKKPFPDYPPDEQSSLIRERRLEGYDDQELQRILILFGTDVTDRGLYGIGRSREEMIYEIARGRFYDCLIPPKELIEFCWEHDVELELGSEERP